MGIEGIAFAVFFLIAGVVGVWYVKSKRKEINTKVDEAASKVNEWKDKLK